METLDWKQFLAEYSHELATRRQYLDWAEVPQSARDAKWFGYDPATEELIASTERKLGVTLPSDLRDFYLVTNGWMLCGSSVDDIQELRYGTWAAWNPGMEWSARTFGEFFRNSRDVLLQIIE